MARTKTAASSGTPECHWDLADEDASMYETTCQHAFQFNDDGPRENGFEFCPYCGRKLKAKAVAVRSTMRPQEDHS